MQLDYFLTTAAAVAGAKNDKSPHKWTQFCKCIIKKKLKYHFDISIQTLMSVLG